MVLILMHPLIKIRPKTEKRKGIIYKRKRKKRRREVGT